MNEGPSYTALFKRFKKIEGEAEGREQIPSTRIQEVFAAAGESLKQVSDPEELIAQTLRVCEQQYPKLGLHLSDTGAIISSLLNDDHFQKEYPKAVRKLYGDEREAELDGFFDDDNIKNTTQAGLLHDLGKLDPEIMKLCEWDNKTMGPFPRVQGLYKIRQHPAIDELLQDAGIQNKTIKAAILDHHAPFAWGTKDPSSFYGFEKGMSNTSALHYLFLSTNIVTICDILSAMTEYRSYHQADRIVLWEQTAEEIRKRFDSDTEREVHALRYTVERELRECLPMDVEGRITELSLQTFARLYETIERKAQTRKILKDKKLPQDFKARMIPRQK